MSAFSPLLAITLALILGIIWQSTGLLPWIALVFVGIAVATFFARQYQQTTFVALITTFFVAGALRYEQQQHNFERFLSEGCNKACRVTGTIEDIETSYRHANNTIITVTLQKMCHKNVPVKTAQGLTLKITTRQNIDHLQTGDIIYCPKIFLRACAHEGYKRYLIKEHMAGHVHTQQPIKVLYRPKRSINRWLNNQRNAILQQNYNNLSPHTFTLFGSIFWGKKELDAQEMDPIKDQFKVWGIMHYLARSGLHVLLFVMLWAWLFALLPLPFFLKQLLMGMVMIGYHLLSWPSISFIRSLAMFLLYKICLIRNLQINVLHLLALTCVSVLLINPHQLFFLDFQLSFGLTFALAWLTSLRA